MFKPVTQEEQDAAASITASIINSSMSEYEKVRAIHDYLVDNVAYSYDFDNRSVYTAQGAFNGKAVCQGYTEAFSLLCFNAGIQAEIVSGTADNGNGSGPQAHAWNLVRIDDIWYEVDVTWDDPVGASIPRYDYFLITDAQIGQDHFAESYSHQYACTDDRYRTQHMIDSLEQFAEYRYPYGVPKYYVTSKAEITDIIAAESLNPSGEFVIMWNSELTSEPIDYREAVEIVLQGQYGIQGSYSGNNYIMLATP